MTSDHGARSPRARILLRRVHRERVGDTTVLSVLCPRSAQLCDVRDCRSCEHGTGLCIDAVDRELFLRCSWQDGEAVPLAHDPVPADTPLSALMSAPVRCIDAGAELHELLALFVQNAIGAAPVVDARGRAIGIVTKSDLLRCYYEHEERGREPASDAPPGASVERVRGPIAREIMSHVVFTLPGEADVSRAAALLAYEGIHQLVVTGPGERALGVLSALDILRWLARRAGYVIADGW